MKHIEAFTDGSCHGNPGPGGWGAILRYDGYELEFSGAEPRTTNNRMELVAVINALRALKEPCEVTLTTDSRYVCDAINKGWLKSWAANGWRKSDKKPVLNPDLWEILLKLLAKHRVSFVWVRGHEGHKENERCDKLANMAANKYRYY